jgi:ATPase family associated with various cellular activities (AAA)
MDPSSTPASAFSLLGLLGILGTTFVSLWAALKYIVMGSYRIDGDTGRRLSDRIRNCSSWMWELNREYVQDPRSPESFEAFARLDDIFLYFSRNERLMTAGWKSKETVTTLYFPRWSRKKVDKLLRDEDCSTIQISALMPGNKEMLGQLHPDPEALVYLNDGTYEDIEKDVADIAAGSLKKTGCLLYGPPGNGKTQFVKYLSRKYNLPINVVYLNPDYDNYFVARMFSEVPSRCIVLLEDFDNYFDGRACLMKNESVRFTFDSIINALDGIHNDYRGVVFVMTANDINKIDAAIKSRPSRFKFVREFGPPDVDTRMKILGDKDLVSETVGMSLDQVFNYTRNN